MLLLYLAQQLSETPAAQLGPTLSPRLQNTLLISGGLASLVVVVGAILQVLRRKSKPTNVHLQNLPTEIKLIPPKPPPPPIVLVSNCTEREFRAFGKITDFELRIHEEFVSGSGGFSLRLLRVSKQDENKQGLVFAEQITVKIDLQDYFDLNGGELCVNEEPCVFTLIKSDENFQMGKYGLHGSHVTSTDFCSWQLACVAYNVDRKTAKFRMIMTQAGLNGSDRGKNRTNWPAINIDYGVRIDEPKLRASTSLPSYAKGTVAKALPLGVELWLYTVGAGWDGLVWPQARVQFEGLEWHVDLAKEISRENEIHIQMFIVGQDGQLFNNMWRKLNYALSGDIR